jgi:fructokinase
MGTGLIALDVVINGIDKEKAWLCAGGSCGNVLTVLAYLGWSSYPVANFKEDYASDTIKRDMTRWGVNQHFIFRSERGITPVVVERLRCNGTSSSHEFLFKCPICGAQLPRNRPIPFEIFARTKQNMPSAQVFYFDRVSRAALALAKEQRARGALIVFEPAMLSKERLFDESLGIAHIVKYSRKQVDISRFNCGIPLEIQTLGSKGLRYRFRSSEYSSDKWGELPALPIPEVVDSAGAGDWCTAGILHVLGQKGAAEFTKASDQEIENALLFGEALAALKCMYKGARGVMYHVTKNELESFTRALLEGKSLDLHLAPSSKERELRDMKHVCLGCR